MIRKEKLSGHYLLAYIIGSSSLFNAFTECVNAEESSVVLRRHKRNYSLESLPEPCDFGSAVQLTTCSWKSPDNASSHMQWRTGLGKSSSWIGGPRNDHTHSDSDGGYAFLETSRLYGVDGRTELALFYSPLFNHSGPSGLCISFYYNVEGLSANSLRILLINAESRKASLLWESGDPTDGIWRLGEVAYSYGERHWIAFQAVPAEQSRRRMMYRGYVAIDDVIFDAMPAKTTCIGHCTFEGGFCLWKNMEDDDFDWELGRGSNSFLTGPPRDFSSTGRDERTGGFAYINTAYPRRPGDTSMLVSPKMEPTGDNNPICMRFATHMYGNGIGTVRIVLKNEDESDKVVWEMSGPSGSSWHRAQVTLSSLSPFRLLLIAIVGNTFGGVALDNLSFQPGTCPVVPQTASKDTGDCSFEENMCGWSNPSPSDELDDVDWARQYHYDLSGPPVDHSRGDNKGYYMNLLTNTPLLLRGGTKGWLVSPRFQPSAMPRCIAFYYWMHERLIDPAGLSLGSLRVYVRLMKPGKPLSPLWRLHNHQGERWFSGRSPIVLANERAPPLSPYEVIFEGVWGEGRVGTIALDDITLFDGDCSTKPFGAAAVTGECFFEGDLCGWTVITDEDAPTVAPTSEPRSIIDEDSNWKLATPESKPASLLDHTFRSPVGFIYFDVFNKNSVQRPQLRSPILELSLSGVRCLGFWFVAFGRSEGTALDVVLLDLSDPEGEKRSAIWRLEAKNFMNFSRSEWSYAQVSVETKGDYLLSFEGESADGGFALDDITFFDGSCHTRPPAAIGKG